jgi:hypothetical protein
VNEPLNSVNEALNWMNLPFISVNEYLNWMNPPLNSVDESLKQRGIHIIVGAQYIHWCQLNVKRLSRRNIEFSGFLSLTALPHPNPPLIKGRELDLFIFSPQLYKGGLRGVKRLWDKRLNLS